MAQKRPLQINFYITKSSGARDRFVTSGHGKACGGYIRNLKLVHYIANFAILRFDYSTPLIVGESLATAGQTRMIQVTHT